MLWKLRKMVSLKKCISSVSSISFFVCQYAKLVLSFYLDAHFFNFWFENLFCIARILICYLPQILLIIFLAYYMFLLPFLLKLTIQVKYNYKLFKFGTSSNNTSTFYIHIFYKRNSSQIHQKWVSCWILYLYQC